MVDPTLCAETPDQKTDPCLAMWLSLPLMTFAVTAEGFFGWAASFFMALTNSVAR
ncbi:hypothetical protein GOB14_30295 [Sinorhizobium meliloti]|nr:hypothetical protein [Sinorhizobium meliloti]